MTDETPSRRPSPDEARAAWDALLETMRAEIPGLRLGWKDEPSSAWPWFHRLVHGLGRLAVPDYDRRFTTVVYPVIYFPAGTRRSVTEQPWIWYPTLRHEYVHLLDMRRHPVWMPLSYVLLAPLGVTARAWWELRAYTQSMVVAHEHGAPLRPPDVERLVELFAGRSYLWMLWPAPLARRVLEHVRGRVERGEIAGLDGRPSLWRDLVAPLLTRSR